MTLTQPDSLRQLTQLAEAGFTVTISREDLHVLERRSGAFVLQVRWHVRTDRLTLLIGYKPDAENRNYFRDWREPTPDVAGAAVNFLRLVEAPATLVVE